METVPCYKLRQKQKPNLFPPPEYCRLHEKRDPTRFEEHKLFTKLEVSDPGKLMGLCESLVHPTSQQLEAKINSYLKEELDAEDVFIITILTESEEAIVQVIGDQVLDKDIKVHIPEQISNRIRNNCKLHAAHLNTLEAELQNLIVQALEKVHGIDHPPKEVLTMPASSFLNCQNQRFVQLVCVVNSPRTTDLVEKMVHETFRYCKAILFNISKFEQELNLKKQCQSLLRVARKLFGRLGNVDELLEEIMAEAKRLTNAERCSLFLLDPDHMHLVSRVFDGVDEKKVVKISKDQGIAGHVAATGQLLNINDAYSHPLFYKGMDEATGFRTRNILCFPIRDEDGIVGVAELCNKMSGENFNYFDEEVALAFSIYCGLSIIHSMMYEKLMDAQHRVALSNELMLYHMKVSDEDVNRVLSCPHKHVTCGYEEFDFSPRRIRSPETICYLLRMYEDLGLVAKFGIKREQLVKFLLYVQRSYRDPPYHCWAHAFSTAHFAYLLVRNLQLIQNGYLTELQALAYITSCVCHDIDHRGTTNAFLTKSGSTLASMHSSQGSILERHHLSQTICILNTDRCNFLECLGSENYRKCLDLIKNNILATDLANHLKMLEAQQAMAETGYNNKNPEHENLLQCLLMTCADLSDQTKHWSVVKKVAKYITDEFFYQGDLEKEMDTTPTPMNDRDRADISDMQTGFIKIVILPLYSVLCTMFPQMEILLERINVNIQCWTACKPFLEEAKKKNIHTMEILESEAVRKIIYEILAPYRSEQTKSELSANSTLEA